MRLSRIVPLTACAALVAIAMPALVLPVAGPFQAARVIFLMTPDLSTLPPGVTIDRWQGRHAVLGGVDARVARALYAQGAFMVYPVRSRGCLALSQT